MFFWANSVYYMSVIIGDNIIVRAGAIVTKDAR
jgi:tetrahydrodipicolinate N-succinyltransferase